MIVFKVVLKNRNVKLPYQDFAVFVIQEWKKIGIEAENRPVETATWFADGRDQGNFELIVNPGGGFVDDPDQMLNRHITGSPRSGAATPTPPSTTCSPGRPGPWTRPSAGDWSSSSRKIALENAYYLPGLWWIRNVVHWSKVKNYVAQPSQFTNQKLQDVWLLED